MASALKIKPSPLRDLAILMTIACAVLLFGFLIFKVSTEWGAQPQEVLDHMSETPFRYQPPNDWDIGGIGVRAEPQTDALGAVSVYLREPNGSIENGALALIQYKVMTSDIAARRAWEDSTTAMKEPTSDGMPRRLFRLSGLGDPHLCVDKSEAGSNSTFCQVLIDEVYYEAFDRSSGPRGCDCVVWMTKTAAQHLESIKASIGVW
jgi:hypothetical protein